MTNVDAEFRPHRDCIHNEEFLPYDHVAARRLQAAVRGHLARAFVQHLRTVVGSTRTSNEIGSTRIYTCSWPQSQPRFFGAEVFGSPVVGSTVHVRAWVPHNAPAVQVLHSLAKFSPMHGRRTTHVPTHSRKEGPHLVLSVPLNISMRTLPCFEVSRCAQRALYKSINITFRCCFLSVVFHRLSGSDAGLPVAGSSSPSPVQNPR